MIRYREALDWKADVVEKIVWVEISVAEDRCSPIFAPNTCGLDRCEQTGVAKIDLVAILNRCEQGQVWLKSVYPIRGVSGNRCS